MPATDKVLKGQVSIITGANSGIGRGIAEAFAQAGARVVVSGRRQDRNAAVVAGIRERGGEATAIACDVTQEEQVISLVNRTVEIYGGLNICVANSGGIEAGTAPLIDMDISVWRGVVSLNLDAVFLLYREAARHMIAAGKGGSLIGISSVASIRTSGGFHYAAAKGGVNALTTSLSDYLGPHGIRINTILPGVVESAATQAILSNEKIKSQILRRIPIGRIGEPDDIAQLALYLAGPHSTFVTGHDFVIDGGMSRT